MIRTSVALIAALTLFGAVSANAQGSATPAQGNPATTRSAPNTPATMNNPATTKTPATTGAGPAVRTAPNEAIGGHVPGMANPDRAPASTQDHEPPSK
jgi:hypothetical protein